MSRSTLLARPLVASGVGVALLSLLTACGGGSTTAPASSGALSSASSPTSAGPVTLADGWVKAADSGMTAMFGTLTNTTDQPVTVVSGTTTVATMVELHEVVTVNGASKMQPKPGGFQIPAHGTHVLKPGGDHIMIMGVGTPVKPGDTVTVTLKLSNGATATVSGLGKTFTAANESYAPGGASAMPSMGAGHSAAGGGTASPSGPASVTP